MATIANTFFKFKPMIKIPVVTDYAFFAVIAFSNINSFTCNIAFIRHIYQNQKNNQNQIDDYQDRLSFTCLESYKRNCLNTLADNACSHNKVKSQ